MDVKKHKRQHEYECVCGYVWIDDENNGCPMCSECMQITAEPYESLPPEAFNRND